MLRKLPITAIALTMTLAACGSDREVDERVEFWDSRTNTLLEAGVDIASLPTLLDLPQLNLNRDGEEFSLLLEKLQGDGLVCSEWQVSLMGTVNDHGEVEDYEVRSDGICL